MEWYHYNIQKLSSQEYDKWYELMDAEKKARVDKFRFVEDKKRTVVGEMLARTAIAKWCQVPAESVVFGKNNYGKPFAKDLAVEFNVSHSGDMVVCAVSDRPVGIDVEQIRPMRDSVAKRICSQEELDYWSDTSADEAERLNRFFEIWTAKEAYCKCIGTGIQDFSFLRQQNVLKMERTTTLLGEYMISIIESPTV